MKRYGRKPDALRSARFHAVINEPRRLQAEKAAERIEALLDRQARRETLLVEAVGSLARTVEELTQRN